MWHFATRKIVCVSFKLCDQIARVLNVRKLGEKAQKKPRRVSGQSVCLLWLEVVFSSSFRYFLFGRGRRFFRQRSKARRKSLQGNPRWRLPPLQDECGNISEDWNSLPLRKRCWNRLEWKPRHPLRRVRRCLFCKLLSSLQASSQSSVASGSHLIKRSCLYNWRACGLLRG